MFPENFRGRIGRGSPPYAEKSAVPTGRNKVVIRTQWWDAR